MERVDPHFLADHLDAVLTSSPRSTLSGLINPDLPKRHKATLELASRLADRLQMAGLVGASSASRAPELFD